MSASDSIVFGVASGILTSVILFLLTALLRNFAIPWYRQVIYNGIDINGEWYSKRTTPSGNIEESVMGVKQHADRVSCTVNIAKKQPHSEQMEMKTYALTGILRDRFLEISGRNMDKQALGVHSELLEIVGDGKTMHGCCIWYSVTSKTIQSSEIVWTRQ